MADHTHQRDCDRSCDIRDLCDDWHAVHHSAAWINADISIDYWKYTKRLGGQFGISDRRDLHVHLDDRCHYGWSKRLGRCTPKTTRWL